VSVSEQLLAEANQALDLAQTRSPIHAEQQIDLL
jgi:hypothetical protein